MELVDKFIIDEQRSGIRVIDDIAVFTAGKLSIDTNQDGADHWHRKVCLKHGGGVGTDENDLIARPYAVSQQGIRQTKNSSLKFSIGVAPLPIDNSRLVRIDAGTPLQQRNRTEDIVIYS